MLATVPENQKRSFQIPAPDIKPHEVMRIYRQRKNITQLKIAFSIHASQIHVSRIERGLVYPTPYEQGIIEELLGVRIWTREE